MNKSISTISGIEFINLQPLDISPLISKCQIKVFYLGANRNHSSIDKDVAIEMAKSLRGSPIVGWYREDTQDFGDHGSRVIIEGDEIKFECLTKPYGFVAPDAKVWFEDFEDFDEFGNSVTHKYLVTEGFIWTGQFPEAKEMLNRGGDPHSMELAEDLVQGHWATDYKTNIEFFIIDDAIFSKLCILGDDVEPCFEGSSITPVEYSKSVDRTFKNTLYSMMNDLKFALRGGQPMSNEKDIKVDSTTDIALKFEDAGDTEDELTPDEEAEQAADAANDCVIEAYETSLDAGEVVESMEGIVEQIGVTLEAVEAEVSTEALVNDVADLVQQADDTVDRVHELVDIAIAASEKEGATQIAIDAAEAAGVSAMNTEVYRDDAKEHLVRANNVADSAAKLASDDTASGLQKIDYAAKYEELQVEYAKCKKECGRLRKYEEKEKDRLIKKFSALGVDGIDEISSTRDQFTAEELESQLSVLYTRSINESDDEINVDDRENGQPVTTFNLNDATVNVPAWIAAVREYKNKNHNE